MWSAKVAHGASSALHCTALAELAAPALHLYETLTGGYRNMEHTYIYLGM